MIIKSIGSCVMNFSCVYNSPIVKPNLSKKINTIKNSTFYNIGFIELGNLCYYTLQIIIAFIINNTCVLRIYPYWSLISLNSTQNSRDNKIFDSIFRKSQIRWSWNKIPTFDNIEEPVTKLLYMSKFYNFFIFFILV